MNIHKLNEAEQAFYDDVLNRHAKKINKKKNVIGVGVGYKVSGGKLTNTVCITAVVNRKNPKVSARDRVPEEIDGVPTDIIYFDASPGDFPFEEQLKGRLTGDRRGERFASIRGGIEIHNRYLCSSNNTAVLGCVVYDKTTGNPMGLTVQHGIAYVHESNSRHQSTCSSCHLHFTPEKISSGNVSTSPVSRDGQVVET